MSLVLILILHNNELRETSEIKSLWPVLPKLSHSLIIWFYFHNRVLITDAAFWAFDPFLHYPQGCSSMSTGCWCSFYTSSAHPISLWRLAPRYPCQFIKFCTMSNTVSYQPYGPNPQDQFPNLIFLFLLLYMNPALQLFWWIILCFS